MGLLVCRGVRHSLEIQPRKIKVDLSLSVPGCEQCFEQYLDFKQHDGVNQSVDLIHSNNSMNMQ
jgi:hypothetical protein